MGPHVSMPKAGRAQGKETEHVHQREDSAVSESQPGGALVVDDDGVAHGVEVVFTDQAVVAQLFDAQEAPVGGKADLPQGGQIVERATDLVVVGIVDGGFGANLLCGTA